MTSRDNRIRARFINGKTRLTSMLYRTPLRLFETRHPEDKRAAAVLLSSHGGGMLGGDQVKLSIEAEGHARLRVTSGANSHIYPHRNLPADGGETSNGTSDGTAAPTSFTLEGRLTEDARLEYLAEPAVLHAESRYVQRQNWRLENNARLLLVDYLQAGRTESGEAYDFSFCRSEVSIEFRGESQLLESFMLEPRTIDPFSAAVTMGMNCIASVYYCGEDAARRGIPAVPMPEKRRISPFPRRPVRHSSAAAPYPGVLLGTSRTEHCIATRIMAHTRIALEPVLTEILHSLRRPTSLFK